jgi:anaerobic selenocysteine-containing dehydrogenase
MAQLAGDRHVVRGTCHHDCPDSCGWEVTVEGGVAVEMRGADEHPVARGELCPKVNHFIARTYHPDRLRTPLRRVGAKGTGTFEPCTWAEALSTIAARLRDVIDRHGPEAILPYSSAGTQGLLQMEAPTRFFHHLGASRLGVTICGTTATIGHMLTMGTAHGIDPLDLRHSRHIVLWGTNTRITNRHLWPVVEDARAQGAKVVVVDPIRTVTAEAADSFVQLLPGTDAALALGIVHVLIRDGLVDEGYVERRTTGFEGLADAAAPWTPERTAATCGIAAGQVVELARDVGTIRPSVIRVLIGAEHTAHGAEAYRAIATIPSITGAWQDRGGGLARSTEVYFDDALDESALGRPDLLAGRRPRTIAQGGLGDALTNPDMDPPVAALVVYNSNPAAIVPDQNLVLAGLARDDLFCVVADHFLTDTARYADVVLPATTQLEHLDLVAPWGHLVLGLNRPAIDPVGESLPNTEIFRRLAAAMGLEEPALYESDEEILAKVLSTGSPLLAGIDRERLERDTWVRLALPEDWRPFSDAEHERRGGRRIELSGSTWTSVGFGVAPTHHPPEESPEGDPELAARFPLRLLTMKSHTKFLNSSYSHLDRHQPAGGEPVVEICAEDAVARGLADGDVARIWNDRGALDLRVRISNRVRPGLVAVPFGWTLARSPGGRTSNALANAGRTDGGGTAFHDNLVQAAAIGDTSGSSDAVGPDAISPGREAAPPR